MPRIAAGGELHRHGLLCWPAEAGLQRRIANGANDEVGWKAVIDLVTWNDLQADVVHLFGIDQERLSPSTTTGSVAA